MVGKNQPLDPTHDTLRAIGYDYVETGDSRHLFDINASADTTKFATGDQLDLQQRYATPTRLGLQLAQTLRHSDEVEQEVRQVVERRKSPAFQAEQLTGRGAWIMQMRKEALNPISVQPVTQQEILGTSSATILDLPRRTDAVSNDQFNLPGAA